LIKVILSTVVRGKRERGWDDVGKVVWEQDRKNLLSFYCCSNK
jgi:hypothetical protein